LDNSRYLFEHLSKIEGIELITNNVPGRYGGIVTFTSPDNDALFQKLTEQGVFCALRGGGIRFSPHFYTPQHHLDHTLELVNIFLRRAITNLPHSES